MQNIKKSFSNNVRNTLELFAYGLLDDNSSLRSLVNSRIFDRNVLGIIQDFYVNHFFLKVDSDYTVSKMTFTENNMVRVADLKIQIYSENFKKVRSLDTKVPDYIRDIHLFSLEHYILLTDQYFCDSISGKKTHIDLGYGMCANETHIFVCNFGKVMKYDIKTQKLVKIYTRSQGFVNIDIYGDQLFLITVANEIFVMTTEFEHVETFRTGCDFFQKSIKTIKHEKLGLIICTFSDTSVCFCDYLGKLWSVYRDFNGISFSNIRSVAYKDGKFLVDNEGELHVFLGIFLYS